MATRPIFVPKDDGERLFEEISINFHWNSGFAAVQKKKNIEALHAGGASFGLSRVLEVSTKSEKPIGKRLSAFNLSVELPTGEKVPLESAYQGSKIFRDGGPYHDLYFASPKDAKQDVRLKESGPLTGFSFGTTNWALTPKTAFYDWLYMYALREHTSFLKERLYLYDGFTDIEFNPEKSLNCQARSCARLVSLLKRGRFPEIVLDIEAFVRLIAADEKVQEPNTGEAQSSLILAIPNSIEPIQKEIELPIAQLVANANSSIASRSLHHGAKRVLPPENENSLVVSETAKLEERNESQDKGSKSEIKRKKAAQPFFTHEDGQGRIGVALVALRVQKDLGWTFREKPTSDVGIDGEIEVQEKDRTSHGRLIAVQIKCGPSYLKERVAEGHIYRGSHSHLQYWSDYSVPVILILCDPSADICWWQEVTMSNVTLHEKGWSILVPSANVLEDSTRAKLRKIAERFQKKDLIELLLRDWIGWRYEHRMRLVSGFGIPRDYRYFSHLGRIEQKFFMIEYILADVRGFEAEKIEKMLVAAVENHKEYSYENFVLAFISESSQHLSNLPDPPAIDGVCIEYVPLLLITNKQPRLGELAKGDKLIAFYDQGLTVDDWLAPLETMAKRSPASLHPDEEVERS